MDTETFLAKFNQYNNFGNTQGQVFEIDADDKVIYRMEITQDHLSSPGIGHGGALAGFMDGVLGLSTLYEAVKIDKLCSTVEFKTNFIKPTKLGDKLIGKAEIDFWGKTLVVTTGRVFNEETDQLVAIGQGTFNLYPFDKSKFMELYNV